MPLSTLATSLISNIVASILESAMEAPPPAEVPSQLGYSTTSSMAGTRMFPAGTAVGRLAGPPQDNFVVIDGKRISTAPGLQIRNESNLILLPSMVNVQNVIVRYQFDTMGNAWRIWILTQAEIAALGSLPAGPVTLPAIYPADLY
jgi:hypothetical protein